MVLVGVQLVSTGMLGEMIGSTAARSRDHYQIRTERLPTSAPTEATGATHEAAPVRAAIS
jgi:hypothetical protein